MMNVHTKEDEVKSGDPRLMNVQRMKEKNPVRDEWQREDKFAWDKRDMLKSEVCQQVVEVKLGNSPQAEQNPRQFICPR